MTSASGLKKLVLLGAGHAHVQVLHGLAQSRPADLDVTLIAPHARQLYSGMVPGFVAGHYALDECVIPLPHLVAGSGARHLPTSGIAVDPDAQTVTLATGEVIGWDWLSINTGPVMDRDRIEAAMPGARKHALFVRPIEAFGQLWPQVMAMAQQQSLHLAVIGAGAAGLELAMAAAWALRAGHADAPHHVTLLTGGPPPAANYPAGVQRRIAAALRRLQITVLPDACAGMEPGQLVLASGARLACDAPLVAVGAMAPPWLAGSALALDDAGFVAVNAFQQSTSHPRVFAAGDVATRVDVAHPRSGVYAVRAGEPLLANLRAAMAGQTLAAWPPPARTLNLLACGDRYAIAAWGGLSFEGRWVWRWKDRIDRRFIARYGGAASAAAAT